MDELKELREQNERLKTKVAYFEKDAAAKGFFTLNRIVNQQIDVLNEFSIKSKISSEEKADTVYYKNAKELWENLPKMISALNSLRFELKIDEGEEETEKLIPISAKAIANGEI